MTKVQKSTDAIHAKNGGFPSVVHNTETLRHFSQSNIGTKESKKSFLLANYRWRNLTLSSGLENSLYQDHPVVKKVCKNICWCARGSVVGTDADGGGSIVATSKSCKNQHCAICARRRSAKYASRLFAAMNDPENDKFFQGKYWYMVTLTMKHDEKTPVYFDNLSDSMAKLYRSKFWKGLTKGGGWLSHIELTFKDGLHIHAHLLVCINPLKKRIKDVQGDLSSTWHKITGDSYIASFDIPKALKGQKTVSRQGLQGAVMELFKYSTKTGSLKKMTEGDFDRFAEFVIYTKGKCFIRSGGFFRGMEITSCESRYDEVSEEKDYQVFDDIMLVKTAEIRFNKTPCRDIARKYRKQILSDVVMTSVIRPEYIVPELIPYYLDTNPQKLSLSEWLVYHDVARAVVVPSVEEIDIEHQEKVKQLELWRRVEPIRGQAAVFDDS